MKRRLFSVVLCLSFLLSASPVSAGEPAEDKVYREALVAMLEASGSMEVVKTFLPQMISMMQRTYSNVPAEYWEKFEKKFGDATGTKFIDIYVPIYKRHLTVDDLNKITAFYQSPVGKKLAEATPLISAEAMQAGQQLGQEIGQEIIEELQKEGYIEE